MNSVKVVGLTHYKYDEISFLLKEHDKLKLIREPNNLKDNKAIAVYYDDKKIGYIAKEDIQFCNNQEIIYFNFKLHSILFCNFML